MTSIEVTNTARNEMKVMVLMHLAALRKKLAENPAITEEMRAKARNGSAEETERRYKKFPPRSA